MKIKNISTLLIRMVKYNLKIIFAGKFVWFILTALVFFSFFMFNAVWNQEEINEGMVYSLLIFPSLLLIFYPSVFGIQNDDDSRILEILFGIPDYKYKVWGFRLFMIYVAIFFILVLFCQLAIILLYPVNSLEMSAQLMFPILFFGNMAFMVSTITKSGNGTAVIMIIVTIVFLILVDSNSQDDPFWNIMLNPFKPSNSLPVIWQTTILKNRIFLLSGSIIWGMIGLLNLQKREKFI
jgi:hypothetical protein